MTYDFDKDGFMIVEGFLARAMVDTISHYFQMKKRMGDFNSSGSPGFIPGAQTWYSDCLSEALLITMQPAIEEFTNKKLYPAYSFCRNYLRYQKLPVHTDRPSCEVSITMCLGGIYDNNDFVWPICIEHPPEHVKCFQKPGDILIYKGTEMKHWRPRLLHGENHLQMHLHYVDVESSWAEDLKFDARTSLGIPEVAGDGHEEVKLKWAEFMGWGYNAGIVNDKGTDWTDEDTKSLDDYIPDNPGLPDIEMVARLGPADDVEEYRTKLPLVSTIV
jgi:hypothetical protein